MWWPIIFLGFFLCLGFIPLGFVASIDQGNVDFWLKVGCFRFALNGDKKEKEKKQKVKKQTFESHVPAKGKGKRKTVKPCSFYGNRGTTKRFKRSARRKHARCCTRSQHYEQKLAP